MGDEKADIIGCQVRDSLCIPRSIPFNVKGDVGLDYSVCDMSNQPMYSLKWICTHLIWPPRVCSVMFALAIFAAYSADETAYRLCT